MAETIRLSKSEAFSADSWLLYSILTPGVFLSGVSNNIRKLRSTSIPNMRYNSKTFRTMWFAIIGIILIAGAALAQNPQLLLKNARDSAKLAATEGVSQDEAKKYLGQAIENYQKIIDQKPDSAEANQALKEQNDALKRYSRMLAGSGASEPEKSNGNATGDTPEGLLTTARDAAAETKKAGLSTTDINDSYKKSIDTYNELIKKHPWTVESVTARLELAHVLAEANDKHRNLEQSYKALRGLLLTYDLPISGLQEGLSKERSLSSEQASVEAAKIAGVVKEAKDYRAVVLRLWNENNSKKFEYKIMDFFVSLTGKRPNFSYWFAIVLITILVKLAITPMTKAQFKAMKEMQKVSPLIKEVQAKHKGDQKAIGEKTMAIYKEHKISPFASCLPLLIQMPILMGLFYTIKSYEPEFVKGTFLWIGSTTQHILSLPVPSLGFSAGDKVFFPALNLFEPDLILVLLYLVSMYFSTRLSAVDPSQADQQKMMAIMMPLLMAFVFAGFPSAFLLYWLLFNILQTGHQMLILRDKSEPTAAIAKNA